MRKNIWFFSGLIIIALILSACSATQSPVNAPTFTPSPQPPTPTIKSTTTIIPQSTSTPAPSPTATIEPVNGICSPLQGIELGKLHSITSQGFSAPTIFQDDGHPAVDLAFFTFEDLPSMLGHPVQSILPGKVVLVVEDRFPYGSMILIETPFEWMSDEILPANAYPTPIPEENLTLYSPCENNPIYDGLTPIEMSQTSRSLYVLYSHLEEKPDFQVGDVVSCGQVIGAVGLTGNTVAEHLHLEIRIGPSAARFNTIAMYQPDSTVEERYNYCIWSTSGRFQAVNPMLFWEVQP